MEPPTIGRPSMVTPARISLAGWQPAQPDNYFADRRNLRRILEFHWGRKTYRTYIGQLYQFANRATQVDQAVTPPTEPKPAPTDL